MNITKPIKIKPQIKHISKQLESLESKVYHALWVAALSTGLRISDLLKRKISDFMFRNRSDKWTFKQHVDLHIQKTGERISLAIHPNLQKALLTYLNTERPDADEDELMFLSTRDKKAIHRGYVAEVWTKASHDAGYDYPVTPHTARKTWGYHAFKQGNRIEIIGKVLGHQNTKTTRLYIGIDQEDMDKAILSIDLT